ncbi:MAG: Hsp70 family protein [Acidimicrobiia bacterium]|nr:Hsp70 family protein [Acidimicrobiia bacterium]
MGGRPRPHHRGAGPRTRGRHPSRHLRWAPPPPAGRGHRGSGLSLDTLILPEPVAAATYYAASRPLEREDVLVVYDLGGGTFDVAVVRELEGGFELAGPPEGIERLGGIDIDAAVLAHVDEVMGGVLADLDLSDPGTLADASRLRRDCTLAKEALSGDSETAVRVHLGGRSEVVRLRRRRRRPRRRRRSCRGRARRCDGCRRRPRPRPGRRRSRRGTS